MFQKWKNPELIPHAYGSKAYAKLNFRLYLHFNCRQVSMQMQSLMDCMQRIREFFEKEGAFLAAEQEFIHYFALPFVIEPSKHPSFQGLFEVILKYIDTTQVENCRVILNLKRHKWHENSLRAVYP